MKIAFLLVRRVPPVPSPVLLEVFEILTRRGFQVETGIAEEAVISPDRLAVDYDLYVLKSHTELSLSLAGVLDAQGARMLNPYRSCIATQDKIVAARRLRAAGVPMPRAWLSGNPGHLAEVVEETPLIVKPHRGHRGAGIRIVNHPAELSTLPGSDTPMLFQEYVAGTGEDLKLYVVGDEVFGVRKPFSEMSFTIPGRPSPVSDRLREIALATGRILGLGLYGLDVIETDDGPVVVDVNYFPGYKGVPNVAGVIADYIDAYAHDRRQLVLPQIDERPSPTQATPRAVGSLVAGMRTRLSSVDPSLAAIVAEGFLSRLAFGFVTFALPLYAFRQFGLGLTEVGMLLSLNLAIAIALKPLAGRIADRFGMRPSLIAAIGLRSLIPVGLALVAVPWQLFAVRAAHGVSISLRDPAASVLITEHGGEKAVASAFAWYQTAKTVAGALGKAAAGLLLTITASSFTLVFAVAAALSALPLLVVFRHVKEAPGQTLSSPETRDRAGGELAEGEAARFERSPSEGFGTRLALLPFVGLGFFISATAYMLTNLFPIFATEYAGLTDAQAGLVYVVAIATGLTGPIFGWLSDNVSRRLVLSVRGVANVLSSTIYLLAPNFVGVMVGHVVDDVGKAAFRPAWGALMAHVASFDRRRRGRTFGSLSSGEDAGEMAGPVLAGFLWSTWGVPVLLAVRIALAVATEIYAITLVHSLDRRQAASLPRRPRGCERRAVPVADASLD